MVLLIILIEGNFLTWLFLLREVLLIGPILFYHRNWGRFFSLVQFFSIRFFWLVHSCSITPAPFWGQFLRSVSCSFTWPPASQHRYVSLNFIMIDKGGSKAKQLLTRADLPKGLWCQGEDISITYGWHRTSTSEQEQICKVFMPFIWSVSKQLVKVYGTHTW